MALPGLVVGRTYTPREVMLLPESKLSMPGGLVLSSAGYDGSNTGYEWEIRAGWMLGRITASGLLVPCKRTLASGLGSASTALTVDNAAAFKAGDSLIVDGNAANLIVSINYTTNVITLTDSISWADNGAVHVDDGSGTCVGILGSFTNLRDRDGLTAINREGELIVGGLVNTNYVLGDYNAILQHPDSLANLKLMQILTPAGVTPSALPGSFASLVSAGVLTVSGLGTLSGGLALSNTLSVEVGTAAGAGTVQGDATALGSAAIVHVVSGGDDTVGVKLPTAVAGNVKMVLNSGSAGLKIYPNTDDKINNGSANAAITILENTFAILVATAADNWAAIFTANS